nr:l-type lectin-domain containing receptor kinase v.5 [Quercus suber]
MSFSTVFAFALINEHGNQGRHHFAFTIFPSRALPGPYLGQLNSRNDGNISYHVFMVAFIATHPKFNDIDDNHVVVDLNKESTNTAIGVPHRHPTQGGLGNAVAPETDRFMPYQLIQADIGRFNPILADLGRY